MDLSILTKKYREYDEELFNLRTEQHIIYEPAPHFGTYTHWENGMWRRRIKLERCLRVINKLLREYPSEEEINNLTYI